MEKVAPTFDELPTEVVIFTRKDVLLLSGKMDIVIDLLSKFNLEAPAKKRELLNIEAACKVLGVAKITLYRLSSERKVRSYKTGKALHFYKDELMDYVASGMRKSVGQINDQVDKEIIKQSSKHNKPLN